MFCNVEKYVEERRLSRRHEEKEMGREGDVDVEGEERGECSEVERMKLKLKVKFNFDQVESSSSSLELMATERELTASPAIVC
jgi:hypothetical protein